MAFLINDTLPAELEQQFAAPAAAWPADSAWGPFWELNTSTSNPQQVDPGTGALVLTGFAPGVVVNEVVNPGVGALTLTGFAPSAVANSVVNPGKGGLVLAGFAPSVVTNAVVNPGTGALVLAGFAPSVVVNNVVSPGVGALTLAGFAPSVIVGAAVNPGTGGLVLAGYSPTVVASDNQQVNPGTGALQLTGFAPSVVVNSPVAPGTGQLTLTGFAPTVVTDTVVRPGTGDLALDGYAPTVVASTLPLLRGNIKPGRHATFLWPQGEHFTWRVTLTDLAGNALDLTGLTAVLVGALNRRDAAVAFRITGVPVSADADTSEVAFNVLAALTANVCTYRADMQLVAGGGKYTHAQFTIEVQPGEELLA